MKKLHQAGFDGLAPVPPGKRLLINRPASDKSESWGGAMIALQRALCALPACRGFEMRIAGPSRDRKHPG
jgi:hypothetical protein